MIKIRIAASASSYLRREAAYLRDHAPAAGVAFRAAMEAARRRLADFPQIGRPETAETDVEGLRRLVVGDYVLQYELRDGEIRILSVRHGRQQVIGIDDPDQAVRADD